MTFRSCSAQCVSFCYPRINGVQRCGHVSLPGLIRPDAVHPACVVAKIGQQALFLYGCHTHLPAFHARMARERNSFFFVFRPHSEHCIRTQNGSNPSYPQPTNTEYIRRHPQGHGSGSGSRRSRIAQKILLIGNVSQRATDCFSGCLRTHHFRVQNP